MVLTSYFEIVLEMSINTGCDVLNLRDEEVGKGRQKEKKTEEGDKIITGK